MIAPWSDGRGDEMPGPLNQAAGQLKLMELDIATEIPAGIHAHLQRPQDVRMS